LQITSSTFVTFSGIVQIIGCPEWSSWSNDIQPLLSLLNKLQVLHLTQSVIITYLFKQFVCFWCTLCKFEAKIDANILLLHNHNFN